MKSDSQPRNSNLNSTSTGVLLKQAAENLPTSNEQPFYTMLKQLVSAVSKDSSNNVAIVAITAMFFAFAVMLLKPATPVVNPRAINVHSNSTTTVTNHQEQNQRIDDGTDRGS
ncbi:hypothetical protein H6G27_18750 [Nostoc linckia FACHB-104]|nr:hypothetical protein [Nostoc linckia FACHB-104]